MPTGGGGRKFWIAARLALGLTAVLAVPALTFWDSLFPANANTLKAEFQSLRYESGGLVFRYAVRNLSSHAAQFQPVLTEVHALQSRDRAPVGYPNVLLPFSVPGRGSHLVEVRLELPSGVFSSSQSAESSLEETLFALNGFELVDETAGLRLLLPRGW